MVHEENQPHTSTGGKKVGFIQLAGQSDPTDKKETWHKKAEGKETDGKTGRRWSRQRGRERGEFKKNLWPTQKKQTLPRKQ